MKLFTSLLLVFQFQHNGVSASGACRFEKNDDYECGSARGDLPIWPVDTTCTKNKCCCDSDNGWNEVGVYQANACTYQDNSKIGCFACGGREACKNLDNTDVGDSSCTGDSACQNAGDVNEERSRIGIESCIGSTSCYDADGTIGDNSCNSKDACNIAKGVTIGDISCIFPEACYNADGVTIGDGSCIFERACKYITGTTIGYGSCNADSACYDADSTTIGDGSCNSEVACYDIHNIHGTTIGDGSCNAPSACSSYHEAKDANVTIGDNSCNADSVCVYCEGGSVVPDGTCNDLNNVDEVGTILWQFTGIEEKVCRACFAELRQGNYVAEVVASSTARRRRAMAKSNSHCSILAQEMKEHVVESLSSHKRFVRFLEGKDLPKKCRKEYLSNAVGVMRDEGIFDQGCKLTIKMNAKLDLLKADVPDFETSFKEALGDGLPEDTVVDEVMATKMNCEGGSSSPGGKSKKGKSTKSKVGKRGKK